MEADEFDRDIEAVERISTPFWDNDRELINFREARKKKLRRLYFETICDWKLIVDPFVEAGVSYC